MAYYVLRCAESCAEIAHCPAARARALPFTLDQNRQIQSAELSRAQNTLVTKHFFLCFLSVLKPNFTSRREITGKPKGHVTALPFLTCRQLTANLTGTRDSSCLSKLNSHPPSPKDFSPSIVCVGESYQCLDEVPGHFERNPPIFNVNTKSKIVQTSRIISRLD